MRWPVLQIILAALTAGIVGAQAPAVRADTGSDICWTPGPRAECRTVLLVENVFRRAMASTSSPSTCVNGNVLVPCGSYSDFAGRYAWEGGLLFNYGRAVGVGITASKQWSNGSAFTTRVRHRWWLPFGFSAEAIAGWKWQTSNTFNGQGDSHGPNLELAVAHRFGVGLVIGEDFLTGDAKFDHKLRSAYAGVLFHSWGAMVSLVVTALLWFLLVIVLGGGAT